MSSSNLIMDSNLYILRNTNIKSDLTVNGNAQVSNLVVTNSITSDVIFQMLKCNLNQVALDYVITFQSTNDTFISNMNLLSNKYNSLFSAISSNYPNTYKSLPWNEVSTQPNIQFYNLNVSEHLWVFANSLFFNQDSYDNWYTTKNITPISFDNYSVPSTTSTANISANSVVHVYFYNKGTNYGNSSISSNTTTYTLSSGNTFTAVTYFDSKSPYGINGITPITPNSNVSSTSYNLTVTSISRGYGSSLGANANAVVCLGTTSLPNVSSTTYISEQLRNVTGNIADLLGNGKDDPNCFAYYDPTYTYNPKYRPLDIISLSAAATISNSNIVYKYLGFILSSANALNISGNNVVFTNCVFNIKGVAAGTLNVTGANVVFDKCIIRNPIGTETFNYSTKNVNANSCVTGGTVIVSANATVSPTFYFTNNYINLNYITDINLYSISSHYLNSIIRVSKPVANLYVCNNTFKGISYANPFNSSSSIDSSLELLTTSWGSPSMTTYYQLNIHEKDYNFIFDNKTKDAPDIAISNIQALTSIDNFKIYFIDSEKNRGSNYLKLYIDQRASTKLIPYTVTDPFLYYNIVDN